MLILVSVKFKKFILFSNAVKNFNKLKMKKIFLLLDSSQKKIFLLIALLIFTVSIFEIAVLSLWSLSLIFLQVVQIGLIILFLIKFRIQKISIEFGLILFFFIFLIRSFLSIILSYFRQHLNKSINDNLSNKIYENYLSKNYLF